MLDPAVDHGVLPLALHPVMTFTGRTEDVARLAGASVAVTAAAGDEAAWSVGEALVVEMGAEPVRVPEAVRPLYHAALAHGANHLITLVRDCVDVLERRRRPSRGAARRAAAVGRAGQRAAPRRPRAHRAGRPRRRRYRRAPTCGELGAVDPDLAATYRVLAAAHRRPGRAGGPAARPCRGRGARHARGGEEA